MMTFCRKNTAISYSGSQEKEKHLLHTLDMNTMLAVIGKILFSSHSGTAQLKTLLLIPTSY